MKLCGGVTLIMRAVGMHRDFVVKVFIILLRIERYSYILIQDSTIFPYNKCFTIHKSCVCFKFL